MAMYGCDDNDTLHYKAYDQDYCSKRARQGMRARLNPDRQIARQQSYGCKWSEDMYYIFVGEAN